MLCYFGNRLASYIDQCKRIKFLRCGQMQIVLLQVLSVILIIVYVLIHDTKLYRSHYIFYL